MYRYVIPGSTLMYSLRLRSAIALLLLRSMMSNRRIYTELWAWLLSYRNLVSFAFGVSLVICVSEVGIIVEIWCIASH